MRIPIASVSVTSQTPLRASPLQHIDHVVYLLLRLLRHLLTQPFHCIDCSLTIAPSSADVVFKLEETLRRVAAQVWARTLFLEGICVESVPSQSGFWHAHFVHCGLLITDLLDLVDRKARIRSERGHVVAQSLCSSGSVLLCLLVALFDGEIIVGKRSGEGFGRITNHRLECNDLLVHIGGDHRITLATLPFLNDFRKILRLAAVSRRSANKWQPVSCVQGDIVADRSRSGVIDDE
mmetsp:Transcript_51821/g.150530  ORF Transcript_51821/g.150530 Transcript_51821/m.150530 type:complete len:236 (+) Transcript_51821:90-797(+)